MKSRITEKATLHFDLNHCPVDEDFSLGVLGKKYQLTRHTPETFSQHSQNNRALALIPPEHQQRVTHFVADVEMPADAVGIHLVTYPNKDPNSIAELALPFVHVPAAARRSHFRKPVKVGAPQPHASALMHFGITLPSLAPADAAAVKLDATEIKTPYQVAETIIFSHPDLLSLRHDVAANVLYNHIDLALNHDNTLPLYLSANGPGTPDPYYSIVTTINPATGAPINPITEDENGPIVDKDGNPISWPQQNGQNVIQRYKLSSGVVGTPDGTQRGNAASVLATVLQTTKDDLTLNGQLWSRHHGITSIQRSNVQPATPAPTGAPTLKAARKAESRFASLAAVAPVPAFNWSISEKTTTFGLNIGDYVSYDPASSNLTFEVKNWANRFLGAYVRFYDEDGKQVGDTKFVRYLPAGNTICGIPYWTDYLHLSFEVPATATKADLLLGGLGRGDSDPIDSNGAIFTGVFNIGIPAFLVCLSVGITNARLATGTLEDFELTLVIAVVEGFLGGAGGTYSAVQDPKNLIKTFGEIIAGVIFSQGLSRLARSIMGYTTETEMMESVPIVGWTLEILALSAGLMDIEATTVAVLSSPATFTIELARTIDVTVTMHPDPTHGTKTQAPIWPLESDTWHLSIQYKGGTTVTQTGNVDSIKPDKVLIVHFTGDTKIPAAPGAQIQVTASFYSKSGWLCGKWSSAWLAAVAPDGSGTLKLEGAIIEFLVPLTAQTQYSHYQRLDFQNGHRVWDRTLPASSAVSSGSTDCPDSGNVLCHLVNITMNDLDYALGYTYQASGQNLPLDFGTFPQNGQMYAFQSISALGNPEAEMKRPTVGFALQPYIAYDQFGPASLFTMPSATYQPELDGADQAAVPADVVTAFANAHGASTNGAPPSGSGNYTLPAGAIVTVVTQTAEWYIGLPGKPPLYDLRRETDTINVFPYPTADFSPRNFYLDSRNVATNNKYYLRQVKLGSGQGITFDYTSGNCWGAFSQMSLDGIVVHPNGYVLGVNYETHTMFILQLPATAVDDANAPVAQPFSGPGLLEGLLKGPVALTVTPDGRVLILEQDNARIQAFDTKANPVPCFSGAMSFTLDAGFKTDLNSRTLSNAFRQAYQQNVEPRMALQFSLPITFQDNLNEGTVPTSLKQQFTNNGHALSDTGPYQVLTTQSDNIWLLMDQGSGLAYDIRKNLTVNLIGSELFKLPPSLSADLDAGNVSAALLQQFADFGVTLSPVAQLEIDSGTFGSEWLLVDNGTNTSYDITVESNVYVYQGPTMLFSLPLGVTTEILDGAPPSPDLVAQFTGNGVNLSSSLQTKVVTDGTAWQLVDSGNNATYDIFMEADLDVYHAITFEVEVVTTDSHWILRDKVNPLTFEIKPDATNPDVLKARQLISTMPLKDGVGSNITYLDIGVETKGFIYVLSHQGTGSKRSDYHLDVYSPDGAWLARTPENQGDPGVNGARMVVDQWRNLYTLNYEAIVGPDNRTEPSISTWIPSTPPGSDDS